jgi:hypothetical protein
MNCTDCTTRLHDYVDGDLNATEMRAIEAHIAHCTDCRTKLESLRDLLTRVAALPKEIAPTRDAWRELRSEIEPRDTGPIASEPAMAGSEHPGAGHRAPVVRASFASWFVPLAVAASVALLITLHERTSPPRAPGAAWSVAALTGAPRVDATAVGQNDDAPFRLGQWLETDADSRAKVAVGKIGEVTVDPNSRLRLVGTAAKDHRLELERGTLKAFIWAPPRLFFVDTPSATAVDLGCAYTLTVADNGDGELRVTTGYVALEHGERESIIPKGMMCLTRRGAGPGTPFDAEASPALRNAIARFDFTSDARTAALKDILAQARTEADEITLWHLLARTAGSARAEVFDTLTKLSPPPDGVTRDGILAGDIAMRHAWGTALGLATLARR